MHAKFVVAFGLVTLIPIAAGPASAQTASSDQSTDTLSAQPPPPDTTTSQQQPVSIAQPAPTYAPLGPQPAPVGSQSSFYGIPSATAPTPPPEDFSITPSTRYSTLGTVGTTRSLSQPMPGAAHIGSGTRR